MKRSYTLYSPKLRIFAKRHNTTPGEVIARLVKSVQEDCENGLRLDNQTRLKMLIRQEFLVDDMVLKGDATHFFLSSRKFCDWLVSCAPYLQAEHAWCLQEVIGKAGAGVLHYPTDAKLYSFAFFVPDFDLMCAHQDNDEIKHVASRTMLCGSFSSESKQVGTSVYELSKETTEDFKDNPSMYYARLVVGLGMYCSCFPEVLVNGVPEDLKHPSHHDYESRTIGISEKISLGGTHESPVAHFRSGHFRLLKSEKFTKKRYQVVFVRQTFVSGKAKTVLSQNLVDDG